MGRRASLAMNLNAVFRSAVFRSRCLDQLEIVIAEYYTLVVRRIAGCRRENWGSTS